MAQDDPKSSGQVDEVGQDPELTEAELEKIAGGSARPGRATAAAKPGAAVSQNNLKQIGIGLHNY